jgi:beta-glucanase (GH16 family)/regulation of enolase protein 1 (concanavalin A-like superfamily)
MIRIPTAWYCRLHETGFPAVVCCALLPFFANTATHAAPPSGAGWNLAWNDEFEGTTMDTTKWRHWLAGARRDAVNSPSAVAVADGKLTISTYTSGGTHYTGMISTQDTYPYTYGYIEARIDYDSNPGMWSAFWMQSPTMGNPVGSPNTAGTEIDICEHRKVDGSGVNRDGNIGGVIHWDGYGADHKSHGYDSGNLGLGTGYHIYGMEWTPSQQKFYIDGVLRWTINNATNTPVSQRSEFIILSSEVEDGGWSSAVPAGGYGTLETTTTKMIVDYVRVYRRSETVVNGDFEGKIGPFSTDYQASWSATGGRTSPAAAKLAPTSSAGATVRQGVRGLLPDTGYTISAWGNAGTTSPSLAIGAKDHGGAEVSHILNATSYTKAAVPFTTGPTNRTASVFAKSNNSGSLAYADDFLLRRHATVTNGQLENRESDAWNSVYGGASVSADSAYDGEYAWKIPASGSSAGVEQDIAGLTPSTAYRLSGWTTNGNAGLTFGVKNHGATQVTSTVSANSWTRATVNFTTGAADTTASVFAYRPSSAQTAYADSFFLYQPLAAPWVSQDVSSSGLSGIAGRLGGKFVLQGGGSNLVGTADQMHFLHQPVIGDATITARILSVDTTAYHAKTGVMIRESTAVGARSASVTWGPVNQLADFNHRTSTNGSATSASTSRDITEPPWLRLTRRGNVFTSYRSPDGIAWTRVGSPQTIAMASSALIGIPACSGDTARLAEAALDNVTVTAAVPDVLITSPADGTTHTNNGASLLLTATITSSGTPAIAWSKVSGPGTVTFANASLADTSATFSAPGTYILRCAATTAAGTGSDDLTVNIAAPATADPSLVLRLKLDESSGTTATDSSGGNNHGTASGGLVWQTSQGQLTGAAEFNGSDSYIAVPDSASLDNTSAFTLSWWFKANTFNGSGLVAKRISFDNNNSYGTFLTVDGKLNVDFNSNNNRFTSTTTFNPGAWYHVAMVFDGTLTEAQRAKLYVNGTLDKTSTETSTSIPNYASTLHIGTLLPGSPVFDGLIDEVRFHRRALSASEILAIKNETDTYAPNVSAGTAPAAIVNTPAALNGSVSAGAGSTPTAAWTKVSGPGNVVFDNAASPATTVTFDQPGAYVLRLTATNANGQSFAELSDTVFPAALPVPDLTITNPPAPVFLADISHTLRLTATPDTHGVPGVPGYAWSQISGPGTTTFADPAAADTTATFSAPGNYMLRCTVTNAGGSTSADASITVSTPASLTLRQGENGYSHAATFLRSDTTSWNSGARDQVLVGRNDTAAKLFRSVFSFPLTGVPSNATLTGITLDLWTHDTQAGTGSVLTLELRELIGTPVEGTGNSSTDTANGATTGATWINRTQTTAWSTVGGDFNATVLSSVPGFNANTSLGVQKTFPSSTAFLAAAQSAVASASPLNLMLFSPSTESSGAANFTRLASDDHATTAPRLTLIWTVNPAPVINPGTAPAATTGEPASLTASATGAASTTWSLVSGPGTATFGNPALAATTVTFDQSGDYLLKLTATNANGEVSRTLAVAVALNPAIFADWQAITWPGVSDPEIIGPDKDPDSDGIANNLEWALHLNAMAADVFTPTLQLAGSNIEYTYIRRKTAPGEASFQVEWSGTLSDDWSTDSVLTDPPVPLIAPAGAESVRATIPMGISGTRFVRLRVQFP